MKGSSDASYKRIQRFVQQADPRQALWRLFQEQAEFAIGDPNEIERPHPGRQTKKIYFARVKIDETFRDLKSLLGMTKLMNYSRGKWKRCWRCYCLCSPSKEKDKKWKRYSGLFILLKQN